MQNWQFADGGDIASPWALLLVVCYSGGAKSLPAGPILHKVLPLCQVNVAADKSTLEIELESFLSTHHMGDYWSQALQRIQLNVEGAVGWWLRCWQFLDIEEFQCGILSYYYFKSINFRLLLLLWESKLFMFAAYFYLYQQIILKKCFLKTEAMTVMSTHIFSFVIVLFRIFLFSFLLL